MPGILMNSMARRQKSSTIGKKMVGSYPRLPRDNAVCASRHSGGSTATTDSMLGPVLVLPAKTMEPVESWGQFVEFGSH